ncbi:MAG: multi-sensor hybrid histidine kinase [Rickettsiales bacterium]|jgi:signal transduction histidine kinase|nr:multi-sensor hybrid histidine kinase [Rickettsiales bacterium]
MLPVFDRFPIRKKLTLLVVGSAALIATLLAAAFIVQYIRSSKTRLVEELQLLNTIIGESNIIPLIYDQKAEALRKLEAFSTKKTVDTVCIYYDYGDLFVTYQTHPEIYRCPEHAQMTTQHLPGRFSVTQPVIHQGYKVGTVHISSTTDEIISDVYAYMLYAFAFLLGALGLGYLLSIVFQRIISNPIADLATIAKDFSHNHDTSIRATKRANDELGALADSLNEMLNTIAISNNKLKHYNMMLEQQVTDRTRDLQFTVHRLEKANEDKSLWISNMTHEIRTPIHGMRSFSKFGADSVKAAIEGKEALDLPQYANFFERCYQSANRLNYLIEGILDLSKMNAGKMNFHYEQCPIFDILRISHDELQHKWEPKNITVIFDPHEQPEILLICDKNKLIQVVTNLLGNAIKFSPENGIITIRVEERTHRYFNGTIEGVDICIKDQGPGIPTGEEEAIFDTFVQSSTTYDGSGGTGLGLSIAREIVRAHNGEIRAQNNPEGEPGCTFMFWVAKVPLSDEQMSENVGDTA